MFVAAMWLSVALAGQAEKLDLVLDGPGVHPVFVRMTDQLFLKSGDFEAFCQANEKRPRAVVRKDVLRKLHANADKSWDGVKAFIDDWEKKGGIASTKRFWILNGFSCDADAAACEALAARPDVAFVYRQTGPAGLRQNYLQSAAAGTLKARAKAMEDGLKSWADDSDEPFSAKGLEVGWDLKQIQADQVWEKEGVTGRGVVVAVNDQGVFDVPSLAHALWHNPREKLDGKDDDGNGYIDDVFGWDSSESSGQVLGNPGVQHGTFCSGIVGGRPTAEKPQVTGVAPRARIMLVNGMGYLEGMEYALANGADIFSMSYMFVNMEIGNYRGVFRLAAEDMTAAGVLLCGGAGNFATSAPEGKQITIPKDIPCVVAAAGTKEDGTRPNFSSKGPVSWKGVKFYDDYPELVKPDVSAPASGFAVWGIDEGLRPAWKTVFKGKGGDALILGPQGNSFAGPHVAGVAALMFSANSEANPWQVKRILEQTCKDMGPAGRDVLHGEGVVQALAAVRSARALRFDK